MTRMMKMIEEKVTTPIRPEKVGQAKRPGPVPKVPRELIPAQVAATCAKLFVPKDEYEGSMEGYCFKHDRLGLGYY